MEKRIEVKNTAPIAEMYEVSRIYARRAAQQGEDGFSELSIVRLRLEKSLKAGFHKSSLRYARKLADLEPSLACYLGSIEVVRRISSEKPVGISLRE